MTTAARIPVLTPQGHLVLAPADEARTLPSDLQHRLESAFERGVGHGLLELGIREVGTALPADFAYWRDFAGRYVTTLCTSAEPAGGISSAALNIIATPPAEMLAELARRAPPMPGGEYLNADVLAALWEQIDAACRTERADAKQTLQEFLKERNPAWHLVGRVHFNLAENRPDEEAPFAFIATYTTRLSAQARAQHLPLAEALREYAGAKNKARLLSLLKPVQEGATQCAWLQAMVESGELYHPLRWSAAEAFQFLTDVPKLEAAGIVVRAPSAWASGRPLRPKVRATVGGRVPSVLGKDALLDFHVELTLGEERLTAAEIRALLKGSDGLQFLRGHWVEVDRAKLMQLLEKFRKVEAAAAAGGLPFADAMRLVAGVAVEEESGDPSDPDWSTVSAGSWLAETLKGLRSPEGLARIDPGASLKAALRPYQQAGVRWLYLLHRLGLGACLADDMGLGKTIQVLSLLLILKHESKAQRTVTPTLTPSLLVAPASLLANWAVEIERFAPMLRFLIAHPSASNAADLKSMTSETVADFDLVITSYGALLRYEWLSSTNWRVAVIDEAQAIKNPGAKQTRAVKKLIAHTRIALTGTPVENRLSDLWSIFDFTHPGLLGSGQAFGRYVRRLAEARTYGPLRELVRLYQKAVEELADAIDRAEGMGRKGIVLSFLMRFKQICNHPSQWLGDGAWAETDSGKFARLRELADVIAAKQEKMLVFTQFREATQPIAAFLGNVFGRDGLVLHGGTPVSKRKELVRRFQDDELTPFFVLSLKAGGAGLNLTAASHVVHFDRWWNPAVENQATDRAFRIGQSRNVLVHKFVCRGTVEDKIDQLIESKQTLVTDLLEGGRELQLTELSDRELLNLVALDIHSAQANL